MRRDNLTDLHGSDARPCWRRTRGKRSDWTWRPTARADSRPRPRRDRRPARYIHRTSRRRYKLYSLVHLIIIPILAVYETDLQALLLILLLFAPHHFHSANCGNFAAVDHDDVLASTKKSQDTPGATHRVTQRYWSPTTPSFIQAVVRYIEIYSHSLDTISTTIRAEEEDESLALRWLQGVRRRSWNIGR